jgi:Fe-S cluster assembly ATPase SufC
MFLLDEMGGGILVDAPEIVYEIINKHGQQSSNTMVAHRHEPWL